MKEWYCKTYLWIKIPLLLLESFLLWWMKFLYLWKTWMAQNKLFLLQFPALNSQSTTWLCFMETRSPLTLEPYLKFQSEALNIMVYFVKATQCVNVNTCFIAPRGLFFFEVNLPNSWDELRGAIKIFPKLHFADYKDVCRAFYFLSPFHFRWGLSTVSPPWVSAKATAVNAVSFHSSSGCAYRPSIAEQCCAGGLDVSCQVPCHTCVFPCLGSTIV